MSSVIGNQFSVISEGGAQASSFCFCAGDLTCLSRAVVNRVACEDQGASQSRFCGDMSGLCFRAEARTRNLFTCLPVYLSTFLFAKQCRTHSPASAPRLSKSNTSQGDGLRPDT